MSCSTIFSPFRPHHHSPPTMMIMGFYLGEVGGKTGGNASLTKGDGRPYLKSNICGERSKKGGDVERERIIKVGWK